MKGYVYLLCDWGKDGAYKIGVTRGKIENRIKELQTGNSGEIVMCSYYPSDYPFFIEKTLHQRYGKNKLLNEWFELDNDEALKFKDRCKEVENMVDALKDNPFFGKNLK